MEFQLKAKERSSNKEFDLTPHSFREVKSSTSLVLFIFPSLSLSLSHTLTRTYTFPIRHYTTFHIEKQKHKNMYTINIFPFRTNIITLIHTSTCIQTTTTFPLNIDMKSTLSLVVAACLVMAGKANGMAHQDEAHIHSVGSFPVSLDYRSLTLSFLSRPSAQLKINRTPVK